MMARVQLITLFLVFCGLLSVADSASLKHRKRAILGELFTVYRNGVVYTVDTTNNWDSDPQQAFVVNENTGKLVYIGTNTGAENYIGDQTVVINLRGSVVLPGFHDVHMHPLESMSKIDTQCTLPANTRPDDTNFIAELQYCSEKDTNFTWILGGGYSAQNILDYFFENDNDSPRAFLDKYFPDKPVVMLEETSHSAWANSLALQAAGIDSDTHERASGVIMREPRTNIPNGILFENEALAIIALAKDPATNKAITQLNIDGLQDGLYELSANGITSFCDARLFWKIGQHKAYDKLCETSDLTARAVLDLWAYPHGEDENQILALKELYSGSSNNCTLRRSQIKVYMDGLVETTTAAMYEPFRVNLSLPIISQENIGINYFDKERLEKYLKALQEFGNGQGYDFNIHAIGERGIREALDAIEAAQFYLVSREPRHRITHVEVLSPADVNRFKELGVIADFQVAGNFTLPANHDSLAEYIGKEKASFNIPVKSVVDTGAMATLSSDWDVSPLNPFNGLQHATQRGNQSISVKKAIEMYTVNAAYAMRQEDTVGSLKAGMDADIVIIDQDILKVNPLDIGLTHVYETIFRGQAVYTDDDSPLESMYVSKGHVRTAGALPLIIWCFIYTFK